ncbi:hypothetical protein P7C73_g1177, partial [Tremellales sp. Uapishka_1]
MATLESVGASAGLRGEHSLPSAQLVLGSTKVSLGASVSDVYRSLYHGSVIKNLLDAGGKSPLQPITVNASSDSLRMYIEAAYTLDGPSDMPSIEVGLGVFTICDQLESLEIERIILRSLQHISRTHPWNVFVLASQRDDLELAKTALANMKDGTLYDLDMIAPKDIEHLTPWYFAELLHRRLARSVVGPTRSGRAPMRGYRLVDWMEVSQSFNPIQGKRARLRTWSTSFLLVTPSISSLNKIVAMEGPGAAASKESDVSLEPHFDAEHNDPEAAVILESPDHARRLKQSRSSDFIRDLLESCTEGDISGSPITVEASPSAIRLFIQLLYSPSTPLGTTPVSLLFQILDLCNKLLIQSLADIAIAALKYLAKAAISNMGGDAKVPDLALLGPDDISGLSTPYLAELLRCRLEPGVRKGYHYVLKSWFGAANQFDPNRWTEKIPKTED